MIESAGIFFPHLPDEAYDNPLGEATGAAVIFGATGGVMEAALRTAAEALAGESLPSVDFTEVRGTQGIKEAEYDIAGMKVRVAVAHGTRNAKLLMDKLRAGEADYHFIEIMACPGGCIAGAGNPAPERSDELAARQQVLISIDRTSTYRRSQDNPDILRLYDDFYGTPGSGLAHELLHTTYAPYAPTS